MNEMMNPWLYREIDTQHLWEKPDYLGGSKVVDILGGLQEKDYKLAEWSEFIMRTYLPCDKFARYLMMVNVVSDRATTEEGVVFTPELKLLLDPEKAEAGELLAALKNPIHSAYARCGDGVTEPEAWTVSDAGPMLDTMRLGKRDESFMRELRLERVLGEKGAHQQYLNIPPEQEVCFVTLGIGTGLKEFMRVFPEIARGNPPTFIAIDVAEEALKRTQKNAETLFSGYEGAKDKIVYIQDRIEDVSRHLKFRSLIRKHLKSCVILCNDLFQNYHPDAWFRILNRIAPLGSYLELGVELRKGNNNFYKKQFSAPETRKVAEVPLLALGIPQEEIDKMDFGARVVDEDYPYVENFFVPPQAIVKGLVYMEGARPFKIHRRFLHTDNKVHKIHKKYRYQIVGSPQEDNNVIYQMIKAA